jgi:hypothetical protein
MAANGTIAINSLRSSYALSEVFREVDDAGMTVRRMIGAGRGKKQA